MLIPVICYSNINILSDSYTFFILHNVTQQYTDTHLRITLKQLTREDKWSDEKSVLGLNGRGKIFPNIDPSTEIFSQIFKAKSKASGFPTTAAP